MYSKDDILTLAKAGFTATQIAALNNVGTAPATTPPATTPPATTPPATTPPATTPPAQDPLTQILAQLQTNAINQTQQPATQTTDDILASIINPTVKEVNNGSK